MEYPYSLLSQSLQPASFLGSEEMGQPYLFDYSENNPRLWEVDVADQFSFQQSIDTTLSQFGAQWGIAGYLERRASLLRNLPQMVEEERFFHLGVDIFLPQDFMLHLPLRGEVVQQGYEEGKGNFGGFVLIRHDMGTSHFYSLWGHLRLDSLPQVGSVVERGMPFAQVGDMSENGDWFYHTHLQVLTERGYKEGYLSKGYCRADLLPTIDQVCPSPLFLMRFA
ncbi:MAG: hypothetical protein P1V18_02085 [Candidatus Gracilibacteria bacterium]|nr:hypothetical protein [Candidatus Gracilibacteria bacterium]